MSAIDRAVAAAYIIAASTIEDVAADLHDYADGLEDEGYSFVMDHQAEVTTALRGISSDLANKALRAVEAGEQSGPPMP